MESLGQQKEQIKLQVAAVEAQNKQKEEKATSQATIDAAKQIEHFEKLESATVRSLNKAAPPASKAQPAALSSPSNATSTTTSATLPSTNSSSSSSDSHSAAPLGYTAVSTQAGTRYVVDKELVHSHSQNDADAQAVALEKKKYLPCFWIPNVCYACCCYAVFLYFDLLIFLMCR
jgi:cobalamin biosynthesis Mg chelatase CobN